MQFKVEFTYSNERGEGDYIMYCRGEAERIELAFKQTAVRTPNKPPPTICLSSPTWVELHLG